MSEREIVVGLDELNRKPMKKTIVLLGWWFFAVATSTSSVVGPFNTMAQCEEMRQTITPLVQWRLITACWEAK
jgi:hypothetical protein